MLGREHRDYLPILGGVGAFSSCHGCFVDLMKKRHHKQMTFFSISLNDEKISGRQRLALSHTALCYGVRSSDSSSTGQRLSLGFLHKCCRPVVDVILWSSRFVELVWASLRPRTFPVVEVGLAPSSSAFIDDFAGFEVWSWWYCCLRPPRRRYQLSILKIHLFTLTKRRSDEEKVELLLVLLALIQKGDGERGDLSLRIPADRRLGERMYPKGSASISSSVLKEFDIWSERNFTLIAPPPFFFPLLFFFFFFNPVKGEKDNACTENDRRRGVQVKKKRWKAYSNWMAHWKNLHFYDE